MSHRTLCLFVLLFATYQSIASIHLQPIRVPSLVTEGSSVYLHCPFQLDGFLLQSVNWRKNGRLFFAFLPAQQPQKRSYSVSGIKLDLSKSNASHVFLQHLNHDSQGRYSCELSSSQPFHKQVSSEDQLTVVHSDYLLTPFLNTGPRTHHHTTVQSSSVLAYRNSSIDASTDIPQTRLSDLRPPTTNQLLNHNLLLLRQVNHSSPIKSPAYELQTEVLNTFKSVSIGPVVRHPPPSPPPPPPPTTTTSGSLDTTGNGNTSRLARLEIEEDEERPVRHRPAITSAMRPNWAAPATTAQVLPLRPQQFHDIKFLLRNDVLLFQPFSTDTRFTPHASGTYSLHTCSITSVLLLALSITHLSRTPDLTVY